MSGPPSDYEFYLRPETMQRFDAQAISRAEGLMLDLDDPNSGINTIMSQAWQAYLSAMRALVDVDLTNEDGIKTARRLQADVQRYRDLVHWIEKTMLEHDEALAQAEANQPPLQEGSPYDGETHSD